MSSAPAAPEDTTRIQALTAQGRHLTGDEYDEALKMHARLHAEVAQDPKKLRIYQYVVACFFVADESKVSQMHDKDRDTKAAAAREDFVAKVAARNEAKAAQDKKEERQRKEKIEKRVAENDARMKQRGVRRAAEAAPAAPATSSPDAPAAPTMSPPDAPAPQKKWKPITYDPDERRSTVKKSQLRASYSFVKGSFKEKRNPCHMRA